MAEQYSVKQDVRQREPHYGPYDSPDTFLQSLVHLASYGMEVGITLTVGGFLVSGVIVDGKRYFDEYLITSIAKGTPERSRESMTTLFKNFGRIYDPIPEDSEQEERLITFIHLRDARFFHHAGKPIPANQAVWWRGRLTEIQGFSMGTLSHDAKS